MTSPPGLAAVDRFWAAALGCSVADLHRPGTIVVTRPEPAAFALLRADTLVVAVPAAWRDAVASRLRGLAPAEAFEPGRLRAAFGDAAGPVVGPAYQGCADAGDFRPVPAEGTRLLGTGDRAALDELRRAAGETAWEHSAIDPSRPPVVGRLVGGALVAAGALDGLGEPVASVGILTHPEHRGRGHGRAVASRLTRTALAAGSVAHYQTLDANVPSMMIARALGYRRYAATLAVRLPGPA